MFWHALTNFDHVFRDESGAIHGSTGHCCLAISDLNQPAFEVKQKAQAAEQQSSGEVFFGVFLLAIREPTNISGARQTRSSASHSKDHQNPRGAGPAGPAWRRWTCFLMIFGFEWMWIFWILAGFSWNYYYGVAVSKLDDAGLWHIGVPMCGIARSLFVWSRHIKTFSALVVSWSSLFLLMLMMLKKFILQQAKSNDIQLHSAKSCSKWLVMFEFGNQWW